MSSGSEFTNSTIENDDQKLFASTIPHVSHDPNVLFGVLARQAGLINAEQFADGLTGLMQQAGNDLGDVLVRRNQLSESDRNRIQAQVDDHQPARNEEDIDQTLVADGSLNAQAAFATLDASDDDADSNDMLLGSRLKLRFVHAEGGIGQVWMARDRVLGRDIALKELKTGRATTDAAKARFLREVQITSQLQHPGTVPVYEYNSGVDDGRCYYTMKFLKGRTLTEVIAEYHQQRRQGEAGLGDLIELLQAFDQICDTMSYAHSRGILHRDLKGDNVVVGQYGEVVVIDWGLAKRMGEIEQEESSDAMSSIDLRHADVLQTMHGEAVGTPAFMSPEQAMGAVGDYDERTDVYGLAAILYEILAGMPPFVGKDVPAILMAVCTVPPNPPRLLNPMIPRDLEAICLKGLSKDRNDRQQTAAELAASVSGWISDQAERSRMEQEREQFFRMSLDALVTVDSTGRFQQVNPAFVELFGWTETETRTMTAFDIVYSDDTVGPTGELFKRVLQGENLTGLVRRCRCKDGSLRWVQWHLTKLPGVDLVFGVGRDITHEKHDEEFLQSLIDVTQEALIVTDTKRVIRVANIGAASMFGYNRWLLTGGIVFDDLVPERLRSALVAEFAEFIADPDRESATRYSTIGQRKDGTEFTIEMHLTPIRTGGSLMISSSIRASTHSA